MVRNGGRRHLGYNIYELNFPTLTLAVLYSLRECFYTKETLELHLASRRENYSGSIPGRNQVHPSKELK